MLGHRARANSETFFSLVSAFPIAIRAERQEEQRRDDQRNEVNAKHRVVAVISIEAFAQDDRAKADAGGEGREDQPVERSELNAPASLRPGCTMPRARCSAPSRRTSSQIIAAQRSN